MCDGTEGLANVRGVGYIAVRGKHDGANSGSVRGISDVRICCVFGSIVLSVESMDREERRRIANGRSNGHTEGN